MNEDQALTRDKALELREAHVTLAEIAETYRMTVAEVEALLESPHE